MPAPQAGRALAVKCLKYVTLETCVSNPMRVDLPSIRSMAFAERSSSLLAPEWRVGAILQATALRDAVTSELWLQIANQRYPARLASGDGAGPADGELLTLRVLRNSPVLALETLAAAADSADAVTSDALRKYLPRQSSAAPLMANLAWVASGKHDGRPLPASITQAAARLWQALPDMTALANPNGLRNAVARSGVFLESTLASGDPRTLAATLSTDIKALLLNLSRILRDLGARSSAAVFADSGGAGSAAHSPIPLTRGPLTSLPSAPATLAVLDAPSDQMNELARQTEGALSRLTALQAGNAAQDTPNPTPTLLLELPVRHGDRASVIRMRIEQERSRQHHGAAADSWTLEAAMDLGTAGGLHARVNLLGHRISVQLRSDSPGVVDTLAARAPELEAMLREAGLEVDRVVCLHGMPAADTGAHRARLLDVRA